MKNIFLYTLFIGVTLSAFAQDNVILKGCLVTEDSLGIDKVNILNLTHAQGTITNKDGVFEIPIYLGDTILFSAIQFQNIEIYITDTIINNPIINRVMVLDEITLQDIVLTDFSMYDTNYVAEDIDMGLPFNTIPIVRPYSERRAAYLQGGIVSSIVNRLNGSIKKIKKIQAVEKERALAEQVKGIFNDKFYVNLGIPQGEIYLFIDFYMAEAKAKGILKPDFKYELIELIKKKVPLYETYRDRKIDSTSVDK